MTFRPWACSSRWEGVTVAFWIALVDMLFLIWMLRRPVDWVKFALVLLVALSVPLLLYVAWRTWAAFGMRYAIDRNALTVEIAAWRQTIPLQSIQRIIRGGLPALGPPHWTQWPAPFIGPSQALGLRKIQMYASRPLEECLLIDTGDTVFALSPRHPEAFLDALQARYRLGPVANVTLARSRPLAWDRIFGPDPLGPILLGAGMVGALLLFGILMVRFPDLPDVLAFHYNSEGLPDVVREKAALFLLPAIGLFAWMVNGVWGVLLAFRQERTGAYLLWSGALVVQFFSYMALTGLMH